MSEEKEKIYCSAHPFFCEKLDEICAENKRLRENLYGEGPDGDKGVYGVLKRKVSYKTLTLFIGAVLAIIGFFAGMGINHESRISKTETTVERNTGILKNLGSRLEDNQAEILKAIKEIKP